MGLWEVFLNWLRRLALLYSLSGCRNFHAYLYGERIKHVHLGHQCSFAVRIVNQRFIVEMLTRHLGLGRRYNHGKLFLAP